MRRALSIIDSINEKVGYYTSFLLLVMTFMMTYEIISRRLFNNPTSWAWPLCVQVECIIAAFAGGYCLLHNAHVRVDVVYTRFSARKRAIIDIATFVFVLLFLGIALWKSLEMGWISFSLTEHSMSGFEPPIWHLKFIILPIGVLLILLQALAEFTRSLRSLGGKTEQ